MENTCGTTGEQFRRIAERDWRVGRDEGEFEVRSSRFSELRTPNFGSRLSRMSRDSSAAVSGAGGIFQHPVRGGGYGKPRKNGRRADASRRRCRQLQLCDGLDQILVDGHEVRAILLTDYHVGEADKETLLFVDRIGHTIPHGRNEKVANVDAVHSPDADANLLAFGHGPLLPLFG
jgi:hypothetical protein